MFFFFLLNKLFKMLKKYIFLNLVTELLDETCKKCFNPQVSIEIYLYILIYGNDLKIYEKMFLRLRDIK